MTFKQRLEDNALWVALTIAVGAFVAGWSAHGTLSPTQVSNSPPDWSEQAKSAGWVQEKECPAYPLNIKVTAPGDGTNVEFTTSGASPDLRTAVVIQSERPVPDGNKVGYVWNFKGDKNFYVNFPYLTDDGSHKVFRDSDYVSLPMKLNEAGQLTLWALVTDNAEKLEGTYSSIEQIKSSDPNSVMSAPVTLSVHPEMQP